MFNFFSKSKNTPGQHADFAALKADMHSHLIPGVDDGAPDLDTSVRLIRGMAELGYSKIITTPHILWDMYRNNRDTILQGLAKLQEAVKEANIPVEVHAGAEYFLDEHVEKLLRENQPLLTLSGKLVLVEFSLAFPSHSLKDILFELQMQGYQPVIAHPERYSYLESSKDFYDELKDLGCYFQLNILSLTPHYGKNVQELASYLIKKGYYDLIGSDLHHGRHLQALQSPALEAPIRKLLDSGKIRNATL